MNLCKDCRFYVEGASEKSDLCGHEKARHGYVRSVRMYHCDTMRNVGPCVDGMLFEPKPEEKETP